MITGWLVTVTTGSAVTHHWFTYTQHGEMVKALVAWTKQEREIIILKVYAYGEN